jgi:hypothetical protein
VTEFYPDMLTAEYVITLPVDVVQEWVSVPETNFGLLLKIAPFGADGVNFWSSEYGISPKRPLLDVTLGEP